jgi:hypothetical protein
LHGAGQAWVIVETSFNLKCSAAWSQFEATIGQFGGESAAQDSQPALVTDDGVQGKGRPGVATQSQGLAEYVLSTAKNRG